MTPCAFPYLIDSITVKLNIDNIIIQGIARLCVAHRVMHNKEEREQEQTLGIVKMPFFHSTVSLANAVCTRTRGAAIFFSKRPDTDVALCCAPPLFSSESLTSSWKVL